MTCSAFHASGSAAGYFIERQRPLYVIQANFIYATDPLSSLHLVQGKAEPHGEECAVMQQVITG